MAKNKTKKKQKAIGPKWMPKKAVSGICKDCCKFSQSTACNFDCFWCYRKGYLQEDFVQTVRECPFFEKFTQTTYYGQGDSFKFDDADFLEGMY
jgi:hypothetical protein